MRPPNSHFLQQSKHLGAADSSRDDYIQFDGEGVDPIMVDSDDDSDDSENQPICPAPSTGSTLTSLSFGEIII